MCLSLYWSFWNLCAKEGPLKKYDPSLVDTRAQDPVYECTCMHVCISTPLHVPRAGALSGQGRRDCSSVLGKQVTPKSQSWPHPSEAPGPLRDTSQHGLIFDKQHSCLCLQCGSACSGNLLIGTALPRHTDGFTLDPASLSRLNMKLGGSLRWRGARKTQRGQGWHLCDRSRSR